MLFRPKSVVGMRMDMTVRFVAGETESSTFVSVLKG